jgi:hypothetical protein
MFTGEATRWEDGIDDDASSLQRIVAISSHALRADQKQNQL